MHRHVIAAGVLLALGGGATAGEQRTYWTYKGEAYATREECLAAKKRKGKRTGAIAGAAGGAGTALVLGGNVGEAALAAGVGAAAGAVIGNNSRKKC
jgi:hypothetical protein